LKSITPTISDFFVRDNTYRTIKKEGHFFSLRKNKIESVKSSKPVN